MTPHEEIDCEHVAKRFGRELKASHALTGEGAAAGGGKKEDSGDRYDKQCEKRNFFFDSLIFLVLLFLIFLS